MTYKEKFEKLKKLADAMYYAAQHLTTDASRLHKAMDEYHKFIIHDCKEEPVSIDFEQELYKAFGQVKDFTLGMRIAKWFYDMGKNSQEPVSEDLEKAIDTYLAVYFGGEKEKQDWPFLKKIAIHFANWQKKQDQSTIELAEDHAMLAGMEKMKEQMMKEAVDGTVFTQLEDGEIMVRSHYFKSEKFNYLDEVKLIIIKED